ncbi:MAG: hypothetical protein QOI24_1006 [Acidobacteriota bacterium]|jgi:uncharacterized repeat protein (TIGR01451 family)|nr:hypothetical protein [Acidobacteriota bacterium]
MSSRSLVFVVLLLAVFSLFAATTARAQEADLGVTKSGPASAAAGANVPYTITVTNFGPDDASTVHLSDPIPPGMTFVSETQDSGPAFGCTTPPVGAGGTVDCTIATLTAGSTATFTFTFNIPPDVAPGTLFTNIATVSTVTLDPNDENNSAPVTTAGPAAPQADVSVMKDGPASAAPDTDVSYTITVANGGPSDAASVSLDDTLPGTMTFVSLVQNSGPSFNCPPPQGTAITCSIATLTAGATATFTFVGHIPAGTPSGTTFTNTAFVSTETADPAGENNSSTTQLVVSSADVSVTKSAPATVAAGGTMSYVVTVTTNGPDQAQNVTFTDPLPGPTTFVSRTQNSGPAALCSDPLPGTNGTVSCTIAALNNGQSAQFTIVVQVNGSTVAGTFITNTVSVTTNGSTDPNSGNDSANATTTVTVQSDVSVTKSGPATITGGTNISYAINVTSNGPSNAANVTLSDTMPANTTFVSLSSPAGWSCTTPAIGGTGTISCSAATLTAGATANFTLTLKVSSTLMSGTLSNTATVSAAVDTNNGNNSSTSNAAITSTNNLAITKNGPATVAAGGSITYTIAATNNGPTDASAPHVMDNLPANTTFTSLAVPAGWTCTTPAVGSGGFVTCDVAGTWPATASSTFTLTLGVSPSAPNGSTISNTVTIDSPAPGHATATSNATVSVSADVAITKTAPATIAPNGSIAYTINVTNNGPNVAQNVSLTDTLPANTTFTSLSSPGGWSCTTPAVGGTGAVTCTIATFANAATAPFTLTVATTAPAGSTITNTANVSATSPDPNAGNNTASASTNVVTADVAITKTATPAANVPTGSETFTIVVTNNGPGTATGVTVTDILPAGTTFTSAGASQGSCSGTTTVTCNVGTLNNGASATITIVVQAPPTLGPVSNTATVTTTSSDPNAANNSSTTSFTVVAAIPAMSPFALLLTAIALALGGAIALKARG